MLKYILPLSILLFAACNSSEETDDKVVPREKPKVVVSFANEEDMNKRMTEIDTIVSRSGLVASSLYYSKGESGESIQVEGLMNDQNVILKIVEYYNEGNGLSNGQRIFYLNDGKPFVTIELFDDITGAKPQFVDRLSYYDENGKVIKTKERRGDFQEAVEQMSYTPVGLHTVSMDRAMRALNQEKEFETTFQGFIHQDVFSYISVGENRPDGFRSALRLDYKDPLIMTLSVNEEAYIGEALRINYQKHTDQTGFEFQVYAGGKFADQVTQK